MRQVAPDRAGRLCGTPHQQELAPIGPYIADFVNFEHRLIIELAGGQHAKIEAEASARTAWLQSQGFTVLRFWNNQVLGETGAVLSVIRTALDQVAIAVPACRMRCGICGKTSSAGPESRPSIARYPS